MTKRNRLTQIDISKQIIDIRRRLLRAGLESTLPSGTQIMVKIRGVGTFHYYPTKGSFMQSGSILEEERGPIPFLKFIKRKSGRDIEIPQETSDDTPVQAQDGEQEAFVVSAPPSSENGRLPPIVLNLSNSRYTPRKR